MLSTPKVERKKSLSVKSQVTKSEAIAALQKYRAASHIIRQLVHSLFGCWEDGLRSWMAGDSDESADEQIPSYSDADLEHYRVAKSLLQESVALNPYFPDAYILLANAYREIDDDVEQQLENYNLAVSLDPDDDEFLNARMALHMDLNNLDAAEGDLLQLERLKSRYADSMRQHFDEARKATE